MWSDGGVHKRAQNAFLFSLVNPCLSPTKMALKSGKEGYAMYCHSSYGPIFGGGNYHDLQVPSVPNSNNCSIHLNNAYQCPAKQNANTLLTGSQTFRVSEMEVYRV